MKANARIGRWILPGAMLTLAGTAVVMLLGSEAVNEGSRVNRAVAAKLPPAPSKAATPPARSLAPPLPKKKTEPPAAPRQAVPFVQAPVKPVEAPRVAGKAAPFRETPAVLNASAWIVQLAQAPALKDRLDLIDQLVAKLEPEAAAVALEGIVDADLPGTFYEAETLRLQVISKLGALPVVRADAILAARVAPDRPRPQRLMALEMLATRPHAPRAAIEAVAREDHDPVVQEKARWTLARAR